MGDMRCPFTGRSIHAVSGNRTSDEDLLNLNILHQNSELSNPMGSNFDYAKEFEKLDSYGMA